MVEKTSTFLGDECSFECNDFAQKLKNHGMEQYEIQNNYMSNINPDNEDEEMENKEQELGSPLFNLLIIDPTDREDVLKEFTDIEDHVISDVSRRDTMISSKARKDATDV
jgi:hypothetical protein